MGKSNTRPQTSVNVWTAIQNVLIHSINKGQFPLACVAGLLALLIHRMPSEDVGLLADRLSTNLGKLTGLSYTANALLAVGWAVHSRWQRRSIAREMDRIGREKTTLQEKNTGLKLAGSSKTSQQ
jgi:hypothetical protein